MRGQTSAQINEVQAQNRKSGQSESVPLLLFEHIFLDVLLNHFSRRSSA